MGRRMKILCFREWVLYTLRNSQVVLIYILVQNIQSADFFSIRTEPYSNCEE